MIMGMIMSMRTGTGVLEPVWFYTVPYSLRLSVNGFLDSSDWDEENEEKKCEL